MQVFGAIVMLGLGLALSQGCMNQSGRSTSALASPDLLVDLCGQSGFPEGNGVTYFDLKSKFAGTKLSKAQIFNEIRLRLQTGDDSAPENQRRLGVLAAYASGSLQKASPEAPRIILFPRDSEHEDQVLPSFIAAANGAIDSNSIEILEFSKISMRFCPREIQVEADGLRFIDKPTACSGCHGTDTKPIWEPYPEWPHFWGSLDATAKSSTEYSTFENFKNHFSSNEFYKKAVGKYISASLENPLSGAKDPTYVEPIFSVNAFSTTLPKLNLMRINRKLEQATENTRYKYALFGAMIGCPDISNFVPVSSVADQFTSSYADTLTETRSLISSADQLRMQDILNVNQGIMQARPTLINQDVTRKSRLDVIAKLRWLLEKRKIQPISMADWSTSIYQDAYAFSGNRVGIEQLAAYYYAGSLSSDPQFSFLSDKSKYKFVDPNYYYPEILEERQMSQSLMDVCLKLKHASLEALEQPH